MKILSYNVYGVKETDAPIPKWETRQENIEAILNSIFEDEEIKVACFQEVNENNKTFLSNILEKYHFKIVEMFPMKTSTYNQYNMIAVKDETDLKIDFVFCLPHGKDMAYKDIEEQIIDYGMSDYRTTVFVYIVYNKISYLIGNIHTDYISIEGKIKGMLKTLAYMDQIVANHKIVIGDMNMVSHMAEVYQILKQNKNYVTISRNNNFNILDNSWHGYGTKEQVNVDFAFVEREKADCYDYKIIKQANINKEGSDHRPIILTIKNKEE